MASKLLTLVATVVFCVSIASLVNAQPRPGRSVNAPPDASERCDNVIPVTWHSDACCARQCPKGWSNLPVLMISLDAFRAEYLLRHKTSSLQRLIDCGSHAKYMYPAYPSKTFPNHYSLVTGLYPESNGIIDNNMYDPTIEPPGDRNFKMSLPSALNPQWWKGEPIWNTATRNGVKSAAWMWPGSAVNIQGMYPTYWQPFNGSIPFVNAIDTVIDWLKLGDSERPSLITLYMDQPDHDAHSNGPLSAQVTNQIMLVDGVINYLMNQLYDNDMFHCVNKIILADHGMEQTNTSSYIQLSDYITTKEQKDNEMKVFQGPAARIQFTNDNYTADDAINATRCKDERFRVYKRLETPKRLHFSSSPRIGDILLDTDAHVTVFTDKQPSKPLLGDHGYDYKDESMHCLFLAHGPAFKQNFTTESFQNVEVFNLLADLLALKIRPENNGTTGALYDILRNPPSTPSKDDLIVPQECPVEENSQVQKCGECKQIDSTLDTCFQSKILARISKSQSNFCALSKRGVVRDSVLDGPVAVQSVVTAQTKLINSNAINCSLFQKLQIGNITGCKDIDSLNGMLNEKNASSYPLQPFDSGNTACAADWYAKSALYDGFYNGIWTSLQQITLNHARTFGNLTVISGVIFDYDGNGRADSSKIIQKLAPIATGASAYIPSHIYQILIRCDTQWTADGQCTNPSVMSFVLPNKPEMDNCQATQNYLYMNTARIRDIELLTGLEFFVDWPFELAMKLRTHVNQDLW